MKQRESRLSGNIQKVLRAQGYFVFKVWGNEMMMAGLPDLIVCARGIFIGLEVKLPESRNNVSVIQEHRHEQIRASGGAVYVVCSIQEAVNRVLEELGHWHFAGDPIEDIPE